MKERPYQLLESDADVNWTSLRDLDAHVVVVVICLFVSTDKEPAFLPMKSIDSFVKDCIPIVQFIYAQSSSEVVVLKRRKRCRIS